MVNGTLGTDSAGKGYSDLKGASNTRPETAVLALIMLKGYYYYYYIIIEFLTSQLWLGNIHLSWDVVINRIRLGGLICNLKSFLQLNMSQELEIFAAVYMYYYYYYYYYCHHHHHLLYAGYLYLYS